MYTRWNLYWYEEKKSLKFEMHLIEREKKKNYDSSSSGSGQQQQPNSTISNRSKIKHI